MYSGKYKILHISIKKDGSVERGVMGSFVAAADEILLISEDLLGYIDGNADASTIRKTFANSPYFLIIRERD